MAECKVHSLSLCFHVKAVHHPLAKVVIDVDVGARHTPKIHRVYTRSVLLNVESLPIERLAKFVPYLAQ